MADCLESLTSKESSSSGRNWCLTKASQLRGTIEATESSSNEAFQKLAPLDTVRLLSTRLATEKVDGVVQRVLVQFNDRDDEDVEFEVR